MTVFWIVILCVALIAMIFVTICVNISNRFQHTIVKIEEANANISIALMKRFDLLTKAKSAVQTSMRHEEEIFTKVIALRKNDTIAEKAAQCQTLDEWQKTIFVTAEAYPQLLSSEGFKKLQEAIRDVEEHLQAARRLYNSNVSIYNQLVVQFPSSWFANAKNFHKKDFFLVEERKQQDVGMHF